jgi:hypothetical protein
MNLRPLGLVLSLVLVNHSATFAQMSEAERGAAQRDLEGLLVGKVFVAKTTFPAWKDGIDLGIDGSRSLQWTTRMIKDHGVGIETGDQASVTAVKVKEKHIEVHLDGGGAGTTMDVFMSSKAKRNAREASGGKLPGGSRINLRFGRPLANDDVTNLARLADYLDPVVDASSLRQAASRQAIPAEFKDAASRGYVAEGMDKATVFAIMGEPKSKNVDTSGDVPTEKWVFELKNLQTRLVTFKAGRVARVDEF